MSLPTANSHTLAQGGRAQIARCRDGDGTTVTPAYLQRKLSVGYNKAAKLVEQMEAEGVISQANHVGKREVLVPER
jgi:DNA segregation ATPase FtsK/SpoIIIE-like protein